MKCLDSAIKLCGILSVANSIFIYSGENYEKLQQIENKKRFCSVEGDIESLMKVFEEYEKIDFDISD